MKTWIQNFWYLLCFFCCINSNRSSAQTTPDPGTPGSYTVSKAEYDLGDLAATLPSLITAELRGSVHYPTGLSGGPFPLLLLLHGRHLTCYKTADPATVSMDWPPPSGYQPITSYEGYDYFARLMASHGYIVISISANAINSKDGALTDYGTQARAELIQQHLDLWKKYNTSGGAPFGSLFAGKLDLSRIGTMGHSRGGEAVIRQALMNKAAGAPYGVKAIITLAPFNAQRQKLNGTPILNIAPYCDGDISDLQGVFYYDDTRYNDPADTTARYSVTMLGANHNYFNTVWTPGAYVAGASDDWWIGSYTHCNATAPGNKRFTPAQQTAAFAAYAAAFFRTYLEHDARFTPILETEDLLPPASTGVDSSSIFVSYHPPAHKRRDINRTDSLSKADINDLGGTVTSAGLSTAAICGAGFSVPVCSPFLSDMQMPHAGFFSSPGLGSMNLFWERMTDYYENEIPPAYQDVSHYKNLQFRVAIDFATVHPSSVLPDFTVELIDAAGLTSSRQASAHTNVLVYPPGWTGVLMYDVLPRMMSHTVKIPLSAFKGINQKAVRKLRIRFNDPSTGAVMLSELCFSGGNSCDSIRANFGHRTPSLYHVIFTDSTRTAAGDSLSWLWRFGDPGSGMADTSSLQHPDHIFSGPGTYRVCLIVRKMSYKTAICVDSICKDITVLPTGINDPATEQLILMPNPARDQFRIYGTGLGGHLQLLNLYGQRVFQTTVTADFIPLPGNLISGVYIVLLKKPDGITLVQKLTINR